MTDGQVFFLIVGAIVVLSIVFRRKKPPETVFIEVFEVFEVRKPRKAPRFLVNVAIVAAIGVFIWAVNH